MTNTDFFTDESIQDVLRKTKDIISEKIDNSINPTFENEILKHLQFIFSSILENPDFWNMNCSICIDEYGKRLKSYLFGISQDNAINADQAQSVFSLAFTFWRELEISTGYERSPSEDEIINFTRKNIDLFEPYSRIRIEYADRDLPTALFKKILNSNAIDSLRGISKTIQEAEALTQLWNDKLGDKIDSAKKLEQSVIKYGDAFNFVGLNKGFSLLLKTKKKERCGLIVIMSIISALIVGPLIYKLWHLSSDMNNYTGFAYILKNSSPQINISSTMLFLFSAISYIAVMLYFFRVALFNYKSVCAQILQIELRMTLCRFIQHYSEHAAAIKKNSDVTLDRFETVIFSGLVSNDSDLPTTFDGVEQLVSLFKTVKGS